MVPNGVYRCSRILMSQKQCVRHSSGRNRRAPASCPTASASATSHLRAPLFFFFASLHATHSLDCASIRAQASLLSSSSSSTTIAPALPLRRRCCPLAVFCFQSQPFFLHSNNEISCSSSNTLVQPRVTGYLTLLGSWPRSGQWGGCGWGGGWV